MDFSWKNEQQQLHDRMVSFAHDTLNTEVATHDRDHVFPVEKWKRCAEEGILGLAIPTAYGGSGHDALTVAHAMEGLGYGCRDNGLLLALNAQMWTVQMALLHAGTDQQKLRYLPELIAGRHIGAYALTEEEAGSDAYSLRTAAVRDDAHYVLNGTKALVSLAPVADVIVVFASTNPDARAWGVSAFVVERDTPGCVTGPPLDKMGLHTIPMAEVRLTDCRVPVSSRLGPEGGGMALSNASLEWERGCMLATCLGTMERQLEHAVTRARTRTQFGRSIGDFQSVSHRIVEMKTRLECARLLTYRVAWRKSRDETAPLDAALAKICLSESFVESSLDSLLVHGGHGYLTETEVERDLRDAVGSLLYGGTSDIQRNLVARLLGLGART